MLPCQSLNRKDVMTETDSIVGLQEIADLLEVNRRTPHAWQYRKLLPPPDYASINGLRAWDRSTIIQWAAKTGRLPSKLRQEASGEVLVPRGGRQAKAENLAALRAAGLLVEEPAVEQSEAEIQVAEAVAVVADSVVPRHPFGVTDDGTEPDASLYQRSDEVDDLPKPIVPRPQW